MNCSQNFEKCQEKWRQANRKIRSLPIKIFEEVPTATTFLVKYSSSSDIVEPKQAAAENTGQPDEMAMTETDFKQSVISKIAENSEATWHNAGVITTEFGNAAEVATEPESSLFHTYRFVTSTTKYLQGLSVTNAPATQTLQGSTTGTNSGSHKCRCHHTSINAIK